MDIIENGKGLSRPTGPDAAERGARDAHEPGLGELLRHLAELLDRGSEARYRALGLDFRPRYTPLMRALGDGPMTVGALQRTARLTQGAVSQTIALMAQEELVRRIETEDGRSRAVALTRKGEALRDALLPEWDLRCAAAAALEREIDAPLRALLTRAVDLLEATPFEERLERENVGRPGAQG